MIAFKKISLFLIILISAFISGCATYGKGLDAALNDAQSGDYAAAEVKMEKELEPTGADRLLYHMELAVLKHLQGQYVESNQLLDKAEVIAEQLETTSITNSLAAFVTNPRQGDYAGTDFEKVFINYYKALNYIAMSSEAKTRNEYLDGIENARIESRKLGIRLNALNADKGDYTEAKNDKQLFSTLLDIFYKLRRDLIDSRKLEYRDDAMAHYLTGITYEANGEFDNARISYQKAATSYEDGFAKQFQLGDSMTQQAWFDVVRIMRQSGDYENEWPRLAKKKLSEKQISQLSQFDDKSQVVVIEHVGVVPQRQEMNIELSANPYDKTLELRPYIVGGGKQLDILAWFYIVYADKSLLDMAINYYDSSFHGFALNGFTKTISLGPAWQSAVDVGLIQAIGSGLRITVPYYASPRNKPGASFASIDGERYALLPASSPAIMGINEQILSAGSDIELALARGSMKALTAQKVAESGQGDWATIIANVGRLASQLSDAAETRNWLMLPFEIRVTRVPLDAGSHDVAISSVVHKGKPAVKQTQQIILQENEIQVVQVRSMPNLNKVAVAPTVPGEVPAEPSQPEELETKTKSKSVAQTEQ
jgi:hypothetical protein